MEDVAVSLAIEALKFVVGSFVNQLREQNLLISKVQEEANQLADDIRFLQNYQEEFSSKHNSHNIITKDLLRRVRDSIYEAEDAIDSYVIETGRTGIKNFLPGAGILNSKLADISRLVQSVCSNVKAIRDDVKSHIEKTTHKSQNGDHQDYKGPPEKRKYGPIFKEQETILRSRLAKVGEKLEVIVITGMPGIGKTTLAAKIFHDEKIDKKFEKSIWVTVSQRTPQNILRSIFNQLPKKLTDLRASNQTLSQLVANRLQQDKLFIVMDDVQETQVWEELKDVFESCNKMSKVVVTTYNDEVARCIGEYFPIKLEPLNPDESWSLLEWRVSKDHGCPKESDITGKAIANQCEGLPLVIDQVLGKLFARRDSRSFDIIERQKIWQDVSIDMRTYFTKDDKRSILSDYNNLPYEHRERFLYLGIFPRRSVFSVSKLIRMWIAEGFIQRSGDVDHSLEEIAEMHLKYLTDRNLIIIEDKMPDGSLKTCRMNYLFHDFCKTEAGYERENFLQEFIKSTRDGSFNPQITKVDKTRRYCIHSHVSTFIPELITSRPNGLPVWLRSFVSHSDKEVFTLQGKHQSIIRAAFKLLRVLDAKPIAFNKIPSDLYELVHLRFVTISLNQDVDLPKSISKLRKVQTLIVHTPSRTLKIKANILKMAELRHLKTNASAALHIKSRASRKGETLQALCGVSPKSCIEEFFSKTPNLKKLGIRGQLALLLDGNYNKSLLVLTKLEKLKLLNEVVTSSISEGNDLSGLLHQPAARFPPSLKSLTLSATSLDWGHISLLGSLEKLEELKLKDKSFVGEDWVVDGEGFPSLQTLHIQGLDFVHWECSSVHFPKLRRLELFECEKLSKVPLGLADISTFQLLDLRNGKATAAASATSIAEVKRTMKQTDSNVVFKLSIFPNLFEC